MKRKYSKVKTEHKNNKQYTPIFTPNQKIL